MSKSMAMIVIGVLLASSLDSLAPGLLQEAAIQALAQDTFHLSMSDDHFGIGTAPYDVDYVYDEFGVMAYAEAWDGGNITMYTVSQDSYIRPDAGNTSNCDEIDVIVLVEHSGSGTGCSSIHFFNEDNIYTALMEECGPGVRLINLSMKVDFKYRVETNAQAYATGGGTVEYMSEMSFLLPPAYTAPPGSSLIFQDGFESGNTSTWSAQVSL